jgi:abortive infection bacteriophage resistance protein
MGKQHQPPMNVDEQIKNLKDLGLTIEDEGSAKTFFNNVLCFRLIKAYGLGLKDENLRFKTGVTFNQIKGVYLKIFLV